VSEWKELKLGDLVQINYGKSLPEHKRKFGNVPVFSSAGLTGWHDTPLVMTKGIILGRKGTIGTVYYSDKPFFCIDTAYYIGPNELKYDLRCLFYLLQTLGLKDLNEDSAVPGLNRNTAYDQDIILPSLPEQRAIAAVLSSIDDKIDLLHRQNKTLESLAETLWRKMFVENADPKWRLGKLGEYITVKGGTTPSTTNSEFWNGNINWVTPRDLSSSSEIFLHRTERMITDKGLDQIGSGLLPVGSVLLSSRAPIGYLAISNTPVAINQGFIGIICNGLFSNYFMYCWIKANMDLIIGSANGSTFLEISKSVFKALELEIPSESLIAKFDSIVKSQFKRILTNELEIRTLSHLRDTLLPKLMSGEIKVSYERA
jgi:type I restriction enzyme S subunit